MNDDIDNDIEIQLVSTETNETFVIKQPSSGSLAESLHEKLFYLHPTEIPLKYPSFYDSLSNSPLSLSSNTSFIEQDQDQDQYQEQIDTKNDFHKTRITYKKLTFEEIEHSIQKNYKNEKLASQLDILITFIKGQKHIYTQSYRITKQKINALVFPSLFLSGSMMVISPIIQPIHWSGYFLSGLNALLTIFTSVLNFWNLQNQLNQYNTCANHFDRLETSLIMTRNQMYLTDNTADKNERIQKKMIETETRMMEMKEENAILIPAEIQLQAPIISHLDIFAFIHNIENQMKSLLVSYKDVKNEIRYIMYKWKTRDYSELQALVPDRLEHENEMDIDVNSLAPTDHLTYYRSFMNTDNEDTRDPSTRKEHERNRLHVLLNKKDAIKQQILDQYKKYAMIDRVFSEEIQYAENVSYFFSWGFCRRKRKVEPVLREFMANYGV